MGQQLLTAVVGSYPQPDWLIDRALLTKMMAPRVRVHEVWRIAPEFLDGDDWLDDVIAPRVIAVDGRIKYLRDGQ